MGRFPIVQKKERWTFTWRGWLLLLLIISLVAFTYIKTIVPFLSPTRPLEAKILVVEGFMPDYALEESIRLFRKGDYAHMLITGKKREKGAHLDQYENDGEYSAAILLKLGFDPKRLSVVATDDDILKDRTYQSAIAVKQWMDTNRPGETAIDLVSMGTHSRRSRRLFEMAFGPDLQVGIYAIPNRSYPTGRWWQSSHGFREVNKETIAWIYARFFFYP